MLFSVSERSLSGSLPIMPNAPMTPYWLRCRAKRCSRRLRFRWVRRGGQHASEQNQDLIAGQGLPFETLCKESCLTAVVVVTGGLAVGHGVFERHAGDLERLQKCGCRVAEHLVGVSAAG